MLANRAATITVDNHDECRSGTGPNFEDFDKPQGLDVRNALAETGLWQTEHLQKRDSGDHSMPIAVTYFRFPCLLREGGLPPA